MSQKRDKTKQQEFDNTLSPLLNYNRFFIGQLNEDFIYEMVGVISELKFPTTDSQT